MSLYKRKDSSVWWIKITGFGKPIQESTGTSDKIKAQEYHDQLKAKLWKQKRLGIKPSRTWKEAVIRWLSEKSDKATINEDLSKLKWLDRLLGEKLLDEIDTDCIEKIKSEKLNDGVKKATVNRYLALVRSILNYCKDDLNWITTTPKIRLFKESNDRVRWLTTSEVEKLLCELPDHQRDPVLFALATGLRQSNVVNIKWPQINFELKHAYVEAGNSKNRKAISVPLNENALEVLKRQINKHPDSVFTYKGKPFKSANTRAWSNALKRAGIEDFRWHDLRHTWASWQRQSGTQVHELQKLGGWLTPAMVERYAHHAPDHLSDVATRIDSKFPKVTI